MFISLLVTFVFFFKQKTAYEMRISDWSSDVCSSDLTVVVAPGPTIIVVAPLVAALAAVVATRVTTLVVALLVAATIGAAARTVIAVVATEADRKRVV